MKKLKTSTATAKSIFDVLPQPKNQASAVEKRLPAPTVQKSSALMKRVSAAPPVSGGADEPELMEEEAIGDDHGVVIEDADEDDAAQGREDADVAASAADDAGSFFRLCSLGGMCIIFVWFSSWPCHRRRDASSIFG